jgi:type IV pilus assembly protein PilB
VGLHVASVPTVHGVSVVLRVLDGRWESRPLETLDLDSERLDLLRETVERPDGLVLITGPAGSGRTTTLYALLHERRRADSKLVTIEDPVAHPLDGVTQIEVDLAAGLTFERGLEAALRQAPDVLLLGEILTPAAAQAAVRASLTGHLLLSCLNTPGTTEAVTRLFAMGVPPYLLADTLRAVVAQRLVRRLCENCREARKPAPEILRRSGLEADSRAEFFVGLGCEACRHTGYRGRLGLYEVLPVTHGIGALIASGAGGPELRAAAVEAGFTSLRADAVRKAALGETSLSEALSATGSGAAR